jgi:hypothetical protein
LRSPVGGGSEISGHRRRNSSSLLNMGFFQRSLGG